jgi:hypothetical protein
VTPVVTTPELKFCVHAGSTQNLSSGGDGQTEVAQKVSPWGSDCSVLTSASP